MTEAAHGIGAAARARRAALPRKRRNRLNALEALERGFALFQGTFAQEAWRYYAGALPLVLGFIPMWVINGQIRISDGALLAETAGLAGAYSLRVWAVARYMQGVRERTFGVPRAKVAGALARSASLGRLLAWKITLGAAALATLPSVAGAPWFYSASQFAGLEGQEDAIERRSLRGCLALAGQWYGPSLLLFLMLFPMWIAIWINCAILEMLLPQLLHSIFGVNTLLSTQTGVLSLLRSSAFWLSLFAGVWLALDPIIKCTFVVVYQGLRSRREGDDLRGLLASLPREHQEKTRILGSAQAARRAGIGALVAISMILLGASRTASASVLQSVTVPGAAQAATDSARLARVHKLRQALSEESGRAIYRWHDAEHPERAAPATWLDTLLRKIGRAISRAITWVGKAIRKFLRKLWPGGLHFSPGKNRSAWRLEDLRVWLAVLAALTVAVAVTLFWLRRRRDAAQLSIPATAAPLLDLGDAAVAMQHSEDEWFALADRLEGQGELRLALRAAYLGLLAGLAQREWLTIRRDRTNREYLDEFTRRWRRRPQAATQLRTEIPEKLRGSLRLFDRVWYGSHGVTAAAVAAYRQDQQELLAHV